MSDDNSVNNSSFLPNFCNAETLFVVVLSAELLAIVLSLATLLAQSNLLLKLALNSLFIQWIALSCVGLLCLLKPYLSKFTDLKTAIISYGLILSVTALITELAWWFLYSNPDKIVLSQTLHILFLLRSISLAAIVGAIVLRYLYVQYQWRRNIETTTTARYQALQARIRPHFLFNCMNIITSLIHTEPKLAEEAVQDLADLFRASLLDTEQNYCINKEWNTCEKYLRIEKQRLGKRLNVIWDIAALPTNAQVPPLCLQPLLENAVYHGIEQLADGGTIHIRGSLKAQSLQIQIENPIPTNQQNSSHQGNKIAQDNIRQRLTTLFGNHSDLQIERTEKLYRVLLTIPYIQDENTDR